MGDVFPGVCSCSISQFSLETLNSVASNTCPVMLLYRCVSASFLALQIQTFLSAYQPGAFVYITENLVSTCLK